jgi:hypothetical protein
MNDIAYIVIMGLLTLYSTIVGSGLTDGRKKWFQSLKNKGKSVAAVGIVMLGLSVWQYIYTKREEHKEREKEAALRLARDRKMQDEIQRRTDSGLMRIAAGLGKSFNYQGLKIDSLTFLVSEVRDSAGKTVITNNNFPDVTPSLLIYFDGIKIDWQTDTSFHVRVLLKVSGAPATNFDLTLYSFLTMKDGEFEVETTQHPIRKTRILQKDEGETIGLTVERRLSEVADLKFYLKGTFTSVSGAKPGNVDEVFLFDLTTSVTSIYKEPHRTEFLNKMVNYLK